MLVVRPDADHILSDAHVADLPAELRAGDLLVFNDTKVIPARLRAIRERPGGTGAAIEVMLHQRVDENHWKAFARPAKRLKAGDTLRFGEVGQTCFAHELMATVKDVGQGGEVVLSFSLSGAYLDAAIAEHGEMPLPPYIATKRANDAADEQDYQTIYAQNEGAVAAPTAGLHFTGKLFADLGKRGIEHCFVTLHVGAGTFLPVKSDDTDDHHMHSEWGVIEPQVADQINRCRKADGRVVAVGTTSLRLLESAASPDGQIAPYADETDIFLTPGYKFRATDALLTNFHLPKSTLFMLVSAFSSLQVMQQAYHHAIEGEYRFYSYGDCCLLFPAG